MLKTKAPRYTPSAPRQSEASKHLWDDFVRQVASYARRNNLAYGGLPPGERKPQPTVVSSAWYNNTPTSVR